MFSVKTARKKRSRGFPFKLRFLFPTRNFYSLSFMPFGIEMRRVVTARGYFPIALYGRFVFHGHDVFRILFFGHFRYSFFSAF